MAAGTCMMLCKYCGQENEDGAPQCQQCGTELQRAAIPKPSIGPNIRAFFRRPAYIAWLAAAVVMAQAAIRLGMSSDSNLGEGDFERVGDITYLCASAGISTILVSLGLYLRSRRKEREAG